MKIVLPYVETPSEKVEKMIVFANIKPGQKSVDLGSGDGRVVIAMAKSGAIAYGFEHIEKYVRLSKVNIVKEGLVGKAFISLADFWKEDLSEYDIVTIYGMAALMDELEKKLSTELRPGTVVISNGFKIPHWKEIKEDDHLHFYIKA